MCKLFLNFQARATGWYISLSSEMSKEFLFIYRDFEPISLIRLFVQIMDTDMLLTYQLQPFVWYFEYFFT